MRTRVFMAAALVVLLFAASAQASIFAVVFQLFEDFSERTRTVYFYEDGTVACVSEYYDVYCPGYPCMALDMPDLSGQPVCGSEPYPKPVPFRQ